MTDRADFEAFVASRWSGLVRAATLLTGDPHSAQDLAQEALVRLAERWRRVEGSPDAYVRRILYTRSIDAWRWRRHQPDPTQWADRLSGSPSGSSGGALAVEDEVALRLGLLAALRRLTPRQRATIVLRYLEDRSAAETAEILDCSVGTVKSQTHVALVRLRELAPHLAVHLGHEEALR